MQNNLKPCPHQYEYSDKSSFLYTSTCKPLPGGRFAESPFLSLHVENKDAV